MITLEELREAVPAHLRGGVTEEMVEKVEAVISDPEEAKIYRDNILSYTSVLMDGKFKMEDYINAVIYVSHKVMGSSNKAAYMKTFPMRYQALVARGASDKDISSYVSMYNSNKLVNLILEQTLIPTWILNQDIYQKAINVQFEIMTDMDQSGKVRTEAANSILTHLKRPETKKVELDVAVKDTGGFDELKSMLAQLAQTQIASIEKGMSTKEITHQTISGALAVAGDLAKDVTPED